MTQQANGKTKKRSKQGQLTLSRNEKKAHDYLMEGAKLKAWMESILQREMKGKDLEACLKNGQELCNLINVLQPGSIRAVHGDDNPIRCQENISRFVTKVHETYDIPYEQLFEASDLYERKNMMNVVTGLQLLRRKLEEKYPNLARADRDKEVEENTVITMEEVKQTVDAYRDVLGKSKINRTVKGAVDEPLVAETPAKDDEPKHSPTAVDSAKELFKDEPAPKNEAAPQEIIQEAAPIVAPSPRTPEPRVERRDESIRAKSPPSAMMSESRPKSPGKRVTFIDNEVTAVLEVPKEEEHPTMQAEQNLLSCHFSVHYHAKQDEQLVVVGNCPELGNWNPAAGLALNLDVDPLHVNGTWVGTVIDLDPSHLPILQSEFFGSANDVSKRQLRYKYCVVEKYDKFKVRRWEESNDRVVLLSSNFRTPVLFHDWWQPKLKFQLATLNVNAANDDEGDDTIKLCFEVDIPSLQPGITPRVVGGIPELGSWDPVAAPELHKTTENHYECVVYVSKGQGPFFYKYCLCSIAGRITWEKGDNRRVMMPFIHAYKNLSLAGVTWDNLTMSITRSLITENVYPSVYANDGVFW